MHLSFPFYRPGRPALERARSACLLAASALVLAVGVQAAEAPYKVLHSFSPNGTVKSGGSSPFAGLVKGAGGKFYGTGLSGGTYNQGTIYVTGANGKTASLHSFNGKDGSMPDMRLTAVGDAIYGTNAYGGGKNCFCGSIFRLDASGGFKTIQEMDYFVEGAQPSALLAASDGYLYATAAIGGSGGLGTFLRISKTGDLTVLASFSDRAEINVPAGELIEGQDGFLYGTSSSGGRFGYGSVFRMSKQGEWVILHSFPATNSLGYAPSTGLFQAADGTLFGMTNLGGLYGAGTLFKIQPDGSGFKYLFQFPAMERSYSGLTFGADGRFYGSVYGGGEFGYGAVFSIKTDGTDYTLLHSFNPDGVDGTSPAGRLVPAAGGAFIGTTLFGGAENAGTTFSIMPLTN